ncbi:MAG: lysophospholipid acyltransferase family protein [Betaproteobacteria bacterium]|nr:lysophospholipid acyltransferase family protein [Betaproteobacteria bacterium]
MLQGLLRLAAGLPLGFIQGLGFLLGWLVYWLSPTYRRRLRENLARSGICAGDAEFRRVLKAAVGESGKGPLELIPVWFRDIGAVEALVTECQGWEHVEAARAAGRGIIFLTPHLGCFDISARHAARSFPITVLYRPPKLAWLEPLMVAGRGRGNVKLASTDLKGVRALYRALRKGEAVGLLPDQAPGVGEGVWVDFFGRPAYTMTLAGRLAEATGAAVLPAYARRHAGGRGYVVVIRPRLQLPADPRGAAALISRAVEQLVRECPEQYLWSYNRYKVPAGAEKP